MKRWRKIAIFTMMLALPISMWASISMASHCQSSDDTSHSMHMQMDDGDMPVNMQEHTHEHNHDKMSSQDSNDHANCDCGCDGSTDCSVSGCSASVISNLTGFEVKHLTQSRYQQTQRHADPADPNLLFRPPISLS